MIRHPRPLLAAGVCYGQLDVDCEDPVPVAERLRASIPAGTPIITSPLTRALRLARALDPTAICDQRLAEISFGAWEGQAWEDIDRRAIDAWAADVLNFTPPGGESVANLQARAIDFAKSLEIPRVALVSHAGVLRALIGYWQKLQAEEWTRLSFDFGSLTEIEI